MDDLFIPIIGLWIGTIGVVCVLQDWERTDGVQQPHLNAARRMRQHPTQFQDAYGRLYYLTKACWRNKDHLIVGVRAL